jgi:hypothetical protein
MYDRILHDFEGVNTMSNSPFYYYSVNCSDSFTEWDKTLDDFEGILYTGAILSWRARRSKFPGGLFNGKDYISLCNPDVKDVMELFEDNTYTRFVSKSLSLLVYKDMVEVKQTQLVPPVKDELDFWKYFFLTRLSRKRYSDMPDEVQAYYSVPMEAVHGVALPTNFFIEAQRDELLGRRAMLEYAKDIYELLEEYDYDLKIYELESMEEIKRCK